MPHARAARLRALRARLDKLEPTLKSQRLLRFGDPRVDGCFPRGGLPLGCWHELVGEGQEGEDAAMTAGFAARLASSLSQAGQVVWVLRREDIYAPALAEMGLRPERLIVVRAASEAEALAAIEDAVRTRGVAAVVGEVESVDLTAGRRLQLACERGGVPALIVRRRLYGRASKLRERAEPAVAASRWRIGAAPTVVADGEPGLGPERLKVVLERARGGRPGGWILEAQNGAVPFRVVAELADHPVSTLEHETGFRRAAG